MITLNFDEVLKRIYNAKKGVEVRYGLGQGFEYCKQFADEAQGYATNAKASADKAEQTVAGIEQTKTDAVQAVQSAQTAATTAVQQAQTTATTAITQTKDAALTDIGNAKTGALQEVASSTEAAQTAATEAKASEQATEKSKEAAATSASTATTKASEASTSAGAAKNDADRAEKASTNAANAAMKALKEAAASGAFKGDPGAQGPQGPSGTIIRAYDISLATSGWKATSDSSAKSAGLAYQYDASVSGCTSALEPSATIRLESVAVAQKAGLGSICQSESGYCRFYAAKVPSAAISLRLLLMERIPT